MVHKTYTIVMTYGKYDFSDGELIRTFKCKRGAKVALSAIVRRLINSKLPFEWSISLVCKEFNLGCHVGDTVIVTISRGDS